MAYRTPRHCLYTNDETLTVKGWNHKRTKRGTITEIELINEDQLIISVEQSSMLDFRPAYALTVR